MSLYDLLFSCGTSLDSKSCGSFLWRTLGLEVLSLAQSSSPLAGLFASCCQGSAFKGMLKKIWVLFHQPFGVMPCEFAYFFLDAEADLARLLFFGIQI